MYTLFYLANPPYGGWVSFTAHMALKYDLPLFKVGNHTETGMRPYGYGVSYKNVAKDDVRGVIAKQGTALITAIDKHHHDALDRFPDGTFIVIHDPTEVSKKKAELLLPHLQRFRIITIRDSVKKFLKAKFGLESMFLLHPFYEYPFLKSENPTKAKSISRIDFDKHTEILLEANKILPAADAIDIYGAVNRQYVFFNLQGMGFKKHYKGSFEKSFKELNAILKDTKYCVDMSVIKFDGGGSQYTFLEAIYQGCALVINRKWIEGFKTPFVEGKNCLVVGNGEELADLIQKQPPIGGIVRAAKALLAPHIKINWVRAMDRYKTGSSGTRKKGEKKKKRATRRN
jgi:hypothetical protein